ncbi:unnamed protein product [Clavelina lepadiformis]|uniref:Uncharacterized protein n=1 Tax=Clavelina lepadiformis TaxID=159417 RepID=A0ABP0FMY4_CLALP
MAEMNVYENVQQQTKDSSHKKIDSSIKQSSTKLVVVVTSLALLVAVISLILSSIAMVLDNPHNLITLQNGMKITLSNWQPGFPMTTDPEADRVVMHVKFTDHENKGVSNRLPSIDIVVPLCSRAI